VQGPIGDVFNSRFLAVYGEGDRDLAIAELDAVRNPPGPLDIQSDFPMKTAGKVTDEDVKSASLILFGTPESNVVLKRLAPSLPADLLKKGTVFIHPNPENPERYVVVWNAKLLSTPDLFPRAGWIMPLSLLPDYIQMEDGKIVAGGHFNNEWKKDPSMYVTTERTTAVAKAGPTPRSDTAPAPTPPPPAPAPRAAAPGGFQGGPGGGQGFRPLLTDAQREAMRVEQQKNQDESNQLAGKIREAEQALKAAVLAEPCDPKAVQEKAEVLAKLQADQTVFRIKTFPVVVSSLTPEQRDRIRDAASGALQGMLTGFTPPGGGGRFQGGQGGQGKSP
jgi:Spy/CpxP family protein refolding chaperone